jgi:rSAM/selenodomain-associated transferase 2
LFFMKVSVIMPVLNEAENLTEIIPGLILFGNQNLAEIVVVDGGSTDGSREIAQSLGAKVLVSPIKSRAAQMNLGAQYAKGDVFYFIHADTRILPGYIEDLQEAIQKGEFHAGCYRFKFDSPKILLKINSWFTRFNGVMSGGGDQTLFILRSVFTELGGFDETYTIMEDFDLVRRIRRSHRFCIIPKSILVSARKYDNNSWLKVQVANLTVIILFFMKSPPTKLKSIYQKMLVHR